MRKLRHLSLLIALTLLTGCASSKRMMRVSPFSESVDQSMNADRLNLFPLAYKQADQTSLLWPFIDIDDQGFAIRPLLNVEQNDISVLFPLSSVNTKRKVGWLLNAYKYEDYQGLFPLYHKAKDLLWVFPFWKTDRPGEWGLFPLYGQADEFHHLTLAWWNADEKGLSSYGLFPLFYHSPRYHESWLWPLYNYDSDGEGWTDASVLFGLGGYSTSTNGHHSAHVFPFYLNRKDGDDSTFVIAPLYASFKSPGGTLRLTPLGGYGVTASGQKIRSVLGPVYVDSTGPSGTSAWLAGLGHWQFPSTQRKAAWRLWPLASAWKGNKPPDFMYYLTLGGWNATDEALRWHITPLIRYQNDKGGTDFRAWPLFSTWSGRRPDSFFDYFSLVNWGRHANGHHASLTPLLGSSRSGERRSWWAWPLASYKHQPTYVKTRIGSGLLYNYTKYQANTDNPTTTHHIPLLFKSRRNAEQHKMRVLFGAVSYDRKQDDRTRVSVLKYLYRREREGDDVRRDIFPFVKWDSSPDAGRFSFLGRVWNMERDANGKRKGHVLFIPWGG